jgi:hypothetical protein
MAWDSIGRSANLGVEEYSGDASLDAFGGALGRIAAQCTERHARLPEARELVLALASALAEAPAGSVLDPENAASRLAPWRAAVDDAKPAPRRQRARAGDVVAIPYAGDGKTEVYGWVLFVPKKDVPSPDLGVCVVVLDRDVRDGDDVIEVVRAKVLLGPLHPNDREIREGTWRILGNVAGDFDALLPRFEVQSWKGKSWVNGLRDYAGKDVEDTPANRARVRDMSVGGADSSPLAVRSLRGMGRWLAGFDSMLPNGARRR